MAYLTRDELRAYPFSISVEERVAAISRVRVQSASTQVSVFLSHSAADSDIIDQALLFLATQGVVVHADWKDASPSPVTGPATAIRLESRIQGCGKFVVLATNNALDCWWVPWELGVAHGLCGMDRIALLPVTDRDHGWRGTEVAQTYSRIEKADNGQWVVLSPGQVTGITLADWLLT